MASNPKLDTSSSSPDGAYGSQRSTYSNTSTLERSGNSRDGHEGRVAVLGTGGAGVGVNSSGSAGSAIELPPLSNVLSLEKLQIGDVRVGRHPELKRAINAAVGSFEEDPSLGSVQSKPLETFSSDELKRTRNSLVENLARSKNQSRYLSEAIAKLDKFRTAWHSRKRSRPDSNSSYTPTPAPATPFEKSLSSISGASERPVPGLHNMKGNSGAPPNQGSNVDATLHKSADKNKRVVPNKRVRTSMADTRQEARPNNASLPRPSLPDRERELSRPSSSFVPPLEDKERVAAPVNDSWDKTKMKGRRSGTNQKLDTSSTAAANGACEGDREHKWSGQQHRMSVDNRSRPSEGHGFRSGPVHGITSMHKAESFGQLNGLPLRGANKMESDSVGAGGDRMDRVSVSDRDRTLSKNGQKPLVREEVITANPVGVTKSKAARAPRSNSGAGGPSAHLARTSSLTDTRDRHVLPAKAQLPTGPSNRKRPAPSQSSSPPPQWVGQRQQKMARVARRVNLMPGAIPSREEPNVVSEVANREGGGGSIVGIRTNPGITTGSGVARRVSVSSAQAPLQSKPKGERVTSPVGLSESDESEDNSEKMKDKGKKQGDWEQKPTPTVQKMGSVVLPAKKTRVVSKEEGGNGDGIRRQGRSGRGAVAPRTTVVNPVVEKVEVASANAKQLRSVRISEKHDRPGRPPTKKDTLDRKPITRPRRPVGMGPAEISGESEDDREELLNAVKAAVNASGSACSGSFWKHVEPYFAYLTSADLSFLQSQVKELDEGDPALQIPACGDQFGKMDLMRRSTTPPASPNVDMSGKSMSLANGSIENDGLVSKMFHNQYLKDKFEVGKGGRKGVCGGWFEKIIPLSQRLLAALINESDFDEGRRAGVIDNCHDDLSEGIGEGSPFQPSGMSESDRQDGDSDGDVGRQEIERWTSGAVTANGHANHTSVNALRGDEPGEGEEDILVDMETDSGSPVGKVEMGSGDDAISGTALGKEDHRGMGRFYGSLAGMTAWEIQYQRMSVDDRILLELQSVGLLPEQVPDLAQREDDEISATLRTMQQKLKEQVGVNNGRINTLQKVILARTETEQRNRERFAMDKLAEIAYSKRMGSRGSTATGGKGASTKGVKAAGLAFAKRILAKVRSYEGGLSCFDTELKDILFCLVPKEVEANTTISVSLEGGAVTAFLGSDTAASGATPQPAKGTTGEGLAARSVIRRTDIKTEKEMEVDVRPQMIPPSAERTRGKEDGWPSRAKEREVLLEDVVGVSGMRDVNALANLLGGTKGKRSERDRDGKGHSKDGHRAESAKGARQAVGNSKVERKTKTKPRQKTAPLLKAVHGLLPKPTAEACKDRAQGSASTQHMFGKLITTKQEPLVVAPPVASQDTMCESHEALDLSNIPIPGIEDLGVNDLGGQGQDLGSWLQDFDEDPNMHQGECVMGLEVPMDDLADLGLMM